HALAAARDDPPSDRPVLPGPRRGRRHPDDDGQAGGPGAGTRRPDRRRAEAGPRSERNEPRRAPGFGGFLILDKKEPLRLLLGLRVAPASATMPPTPAPRTGRRKGR